MILTPLTEAEQAVYNAAYAIPALLTDQDLRDAWQAHWRALETYSSPGVWYDRFRELLAEAQYREIFLSQRCG